MKKIIYLSLFLTLVFPILVGAVPKIPHQFYGSIEVNGEPVPDNKVIVASIEGDNYTGITKDGKYGYAPNIFYVEDPDGDRNGEIIEFFMGGKKIGEEIFVNNGYTELNFNLDTTCGDGYCLGDETCTSCSVDCGICTDPPIITIISPESKEYNDVKINLEVSADQNIIVWMYSLNGESFVTFTPSITITAVEGDNNITVIGMNDVYQTGSSTVLFSVELSYCGDGICDSGESCSSCPADCGTCPPPGNGGSPPGGGPPPCVSNWTCTDWSACVDGEQTRTCVDVRCGRASASNKPAEVQNCTVSGVCLSGRTVCAGDEVFECQEGEWVKLETCDYGCDDSVPGAAVCNESAGNGEDEDKGNGGPPTGWFLDPASLFAIFIVVAVILVGGVVWKVKRK